MRIIGFSKMHHRVADFHLQCQTVRFWNQSQSYKLFNFYIRPIFSDYHHQPSISILQIWIFPHSFLQIIHSDGGSKFTVPSGNYAIVHSLAFTPVKPLSWSSKKLHHSKSTSDNEGLFDRCSERLVSLSARVRLRVRLVCHNYYCFLC